MLRFTLLLLLIANMGYLAWTQGWMATLGWAPETQSEAFRLQQQIRPEVLHLQPQPPETSAAVLPAAPLSPAAPVAAPPTDAQALASGATETQDTASPDHVAQLAPNTAESSNVATAAEGAASAPVSGLAPVAAAAAASTTASASTATTTAAQTAATQCMQTGNFDETQANQVRQTLRKLNVADDSWELVPTAISGRWMVYMGKFANEMALEKRRGELRARKISFDRVAGAFEPGLSLGRFSTEEAAQRELSHLSDKGIKNARVVQEREAHTVYTLRLAHSTPEQQKQLQQASDVLANKPVRECAG